MASKEGFSLVNSSEDVAEKRNSVIIWYNAADIDSWGAFQSDWSLVKKISWWVRKESPCEHKGAGGERDCEQAAVAGVVYGLRFKIDISSFGLPGTIPISDTDCFLPCWHHLEEIQRKVDEDLQKQNIKQPGSAIPKSIIIVPVNLPGKEADSLLATLIPSLLENTLS